MAETWDVVAALSDPSRRALYDYVRRQDHSVRRDEAAEATAMSRGLAAFHLDKLVAAGLLSARYEAPADEPRGRGRTPKIYEVAGDGLYVTMPERRYELIAEILASAITGGEPPAETARRHGRELGERLPRAGLVEALAGLGFEPDRADRTVVLRNCPFHALAARHTALVCGLNLAFVGGLVDGMGADGVEPVLAPRPGACCVELRGDQDADPA